MSLLWQDSEQSAFIAINRSNVIFHVREKILYGEQVAFIGWRENPLARGFPEYYFDSTNAYWRFFIPGRNVLLVQEQVSEERNQTHLIEHCGYYVTQLWEAFSIVDYLKNFGAWDFLVTSDQVFANYGRQLVDYFLSSEANVQWIVLFSYTSALLPEVSALMKEAKANLSVIFFHKSTALEDLKKYFYQPYRSSISKKLEEANVGMLFE